MSKRLWGKIAACVVLWTLLLAIALAGDDWVSPSLPDGKLVVTGQSPLFITPPDYLKPQPNEGGYSVAKEAPTIDFMYFPGQTHPGRPWSAWGEGVVYDGKYYCAVGDHYFTVCVYEYDPAQKTLRIVLDVAKFLNLPAEHYKPGKIHSRLMVGRDGWLYFSTHNGGANLTTEFKYDGDWIGRYNPKTGQTEILSEGPIGKVSMPAGFTDPERLIVYGGTEQGLKFFAFDVATRKVLYTSPENEGPSRCMLFSKTTGRVYYRRQGAEKMWRYDPKTNTAVQIACPIDPRAATYESPDGHVYAIDWKGELWRFNVKTEASEKLDHAPIAAETYTTSIDMDKTGRYLYYSTGAHGGASKEGTPVVQYDLKAHHKKVIAFLRPYFEKEAGYVCDGTFSMRLSEDDSLLFTTWMGKRVGIKAADFDVCALSVIHIPESERKP